ncbi:uncharacterized protein PAC_11475 [Phialocephala subalpina]|uniref:Uncharacterized protein n=1 Tax=Phialocephala subalpina TaxID=576137 RepID=A0A1L7X963_9HELO|nr:uncharacterized protein PAC_11475 [Phialocephala subalpina]
MAFVSRYLRSPKTELETCMLARHNATSPKTIEDNNGNELDALGRTTQCTCEEIPEKSKMVPELSEIGS